MRHHSIICRLGLGDLTEVAPLRPDTHLTELSFIEGNQRLSFGLGQALDQLSELGLRPSEFAVDLALLAAAVTAADTRISRTTESQDAWTREIDLHIPVSDSATWSAQIPLLVTMLNFLTGDHWNLSFRERIPTLLTLAMAPTKLRTANPSCICLFSGGLDSFIGAIDLLSAGEIPILISHYWDGETSKYQNLCSKSLRRHYPNIHIDHIRARVGFPNGTVENSSAENTLRGRSFLFFALAALAADAVGGDMVIHVPENGLISLNVPLDPLRLGSLSTRTTHPFYMARFNDLLQALNLTCRLSNRYGHQTKGQMTRNCADLEFLRLEVQNTMSCSSPAKARWARDEEQRQPKHCGYCVPCLIRRAAIIEGLETDNTPYQIPDLHARVIDTNKAEGEHIRSFQLALSRLTRRPNLAKFDIHRPGPLIDHPGALAAYEAVYVNGLQEVGRLLAGVRAEPL